MRKQRKAAIVTVCGVMAGLVLTGSSAQAQDFRPIDQFDFVYQPRPQPFVPSNSDNRDAGKGFEIACTVSASGHMDECWSEDNDLDDDRFVDNALNNVSRWIVAKHLRSGESSAGKAFRITCNVGQGYRHLARNDW